MESERVICAGNDLQQAALRSICMGSEWVYAVFWRILPRYFPPPKWDNEKGICYRSREDTKNWMLVWEDGFCNFNCGLQPDLFFKMSHQLYNYGEGMMGKVAADHGHKWICRDNTPLQPETDFLHHAIYSHPRTWEAQFHAGIQTIALVAVREGLLQLGSTKKVMEDLNYVIFLKRKFNYLHSIPGVLPSHPSSQVLLAEATFARVGSKDSTWTTEDRDKKLSQNLKALKNCRHLQDSNLTPGNSQDCNFPVCNASLTITSHQQQDLHYVGASAPVTVIPSMSSLEALLSKLPSVTPSYSAVPHCMQQPKENNMDV